MISSEKYSNLDSSAEVTVNKIYSDNIFITQYKNGYRFNADSMILSWFISKFSNKKTYRKGLEIGSGSGVIPIVMNDRGFNNIDIDCVEIQETLFKLLTHNIKANNSLNLNPVNQDIKEFAKRCDRKYDFIFTNPPYFSTGRGVLNPCAEKAVAKHEVEGNLKTFLKLSYNILTSKGEFFFVYPVSRIQEALHYAENARFHLKKILFFKEYEKTPVTLFAAKMIKSDKRGNSVADIITMRNEDNSYTELGREILFKEFKE